MSQASHMDLKVMKVKLLGTYCCPDDLGKARRIMKQLALVLGLLWSWKLDEPWNQDIKEDINATSDRICDCPHANVVRVFLDS